jgi:uncharacterized RmlC-like cupin family protein
MPPGTDQIIRARTAREGFSDGPRSRTSRGTAAGDGGLAPQRRARHQGETARPEHGADARHGPRGGDQRGAGGAQKIWAGTVSIHPNAKTGAHHHGELESVIYVLRGKARMRWGERLEFTAEAEPGDFIFVPPYVPHQEINASSEEALECVVVRSDNEAVVVNLDIEPVEKPDQVYWVDPIHKHP